MKQILHLLLIKPLLCICITSLAQSNERIQALCPSIQIKKDADTICGSDFGGTYPISAVTSANLNRFQITWSTSGTGIFYYPHRASTTYEYTASDAGFGSVWLIATLRDRQHRCPTIRDSFFLKLNDPARIELDPEGFGIEVCGNEPVSLYGGISGTANTVYWSTSGTGTFSPNPSPNTTYYPSIQDRFNGYITISGTTNDPPGPCPAAGDFVSITFTGAVANAGNDTILCGSRFGGSFPVNATTNSFYNGTWSTNGFGYFDDEFSLSTNYNYDPSDVGLGNIELYFTADNLNGCAPFTDTVQVTINEQGWLEFPEPYIYQCKSNPDVTASVYIYGYPSSGIWTTTGTGKFDDATSTYTTYHASKPDLENGSVSLIFTTNDPKGPCGAVSGSMYVQFDECLNKVVASDKFNAQQQISSAVLYPNPAKNMITVQTKSIISKKTSYITDAAGKIFTAIWIGNSNNLNISKLGNGVYFLHLVVDNSISKTIKFIKE